MRTDGYKALLGFYNQTYHAMTMAASHRSIGILFKIDVRLARNMRENAAKLIRDLDGLQKIPTILTLWREAERRLDAVAAEEITLDHSLFIYDLCALAYLTWHELCNNKTAQQCADEYYTVVNHPDLHPGLSAIRATWSSDREGSDSAIPATLSNVAAILKRIEWKNKRNSGNQ